MLREVIERTVFAVSVDETRMNLSGIYFERPQAGKLRVVATDGHRLAMITRTVEGASAGSGIIIPRKGVIEISEGDGDRRRAGQPDHQGAVAHATRGGVELSMRLVEGEFPDYKQVVPQKSERHLSVGVEPLLGALRRVAIVSSERTHGIKLQADAGRLEISSINPDLGEASEELAVDYEGDSFSIGFNAKYLMDVLGVLQPVSARRNQLQRRGQPGCTALRRRRRLLVCRDAVIMPMARPVFQSPIGRSCLGSHDGRFFGGKNGASLTRPKHSRRKYFCKNR